jgi:hypothetical protein
MMESMWESYYGDWGSMYEVESDLEDKTGHKVRPNSSSGQSLYTLGGGEGSWRDVHCKCT